MKSRTYPGKNKTMKYIRKINFSQNNQNPITCMWYKNSKSSENSIDNFSVHIFIFNIRLLFVTKEKIPPPPAKFRFPSIGENTPYPLTLFGKSCLW